MLQGQFLRPFSSLKWLLGEIVVVEVLHANIAILSTSHEPTAIPEPGKAIQGPEVAFDRADFLLEYHVPKRSLELTGG